MSMQRQILLLCKIMRWDDKSKGEIVYAIFIESRRKIKTPRKVFVSVSHSFVVGPLSSDSLLFLKRVVYNFPTTHVDARVRHVAEFSNSVSLQVCQNLFY